MTLEITSCREDTRGVTPASPRMRRMRITDESLTFAPEFEKSQQMRYDRMNSDAIKVGETNGGSVNFEWAFPPDGSPESDDLCSALMAEWLNTPFRDNDGTAAAAITGVTAASQTVAVVVGAPFAVGHLVRFVGFGVAANNALRRCSTAHATAPVFAGSGLVDEVTPPATARMKVVGFQGAAGDLHIVGNALTSEAGGLDLTTVGLKPGMFIKIGDKTAAGYCFDTAENNDYVRVAGAVTAHSVPLDHLPDGWADDAGAGKTIRVFVPDHLQNGKTLISQTIQRRFVDQADPTCYKQRGMTVTDYGLSLKAKDTGGGQRITGSKTYIGMGGTPDGVNLDAAPDPESTTAVCATGVNVARVSEAGARLLGPNFVRSLDIKINNNLAGVGDLTHMGPADVRWGDCDVTIDLAAVFGDRALLTKFFAGEATSLAWPIAKNNQAVYWQVPRMIFMKDGNPNSRGKNTEVVVKYSAEASWDALTLAHVILNRFEFVQ